MGPIDGVRRAIRRFDLLPDGTRVLVAVSGGADSVALLHLLRELAPRMGFSVAGLAHVNHQLRGAESDRDEAFCRALADGLGLAAYVERVDVAARAASDARPLEDAARRLRYAALERGRLAVGATRIAVGHTRDDQAETLLLKLFRGAGPRGLAGIYPRLGVVVRPLIDVGRQELRAWLADKGITHVEDASNADVANPRNLLRHEALPRLEAWFGPSVAMALARAAEIARADEDLLAGLAAARWPDVAREEPGRLSIDAPGAGALPLALQRRVLLEALRRSGVTHPGFDEVETLRSVTDGATAAAEFSGGVRADRNGAAVVLSSGHGRAVPVPSFEYALPVPGTVWVPEASALLEAETGPSGQTPEADPAVGPGTGPGSAAPAGESQVAVLAAGRVCGPLFVRNWRPGDALRPAGLGGRKKLQDLFVDRKVERDARRRLPLVVDEGGRVVWVPGHAVDEHYAVTRPDSGVVVLRLTRKWGGHE